MAYVTGQRVAVGCDVVEIDRFREACERAPHLLVRLFTERERNALLRKADPIPSFAVRFAAKEAVLKLFGVGLGGVHFYDIEVIRAPSGKPIVELGPTGQERMTYGGYGDIELSLSHSHRTAIATAVAMWEGPVLESKEPFG
jgi:holo-[acyl-carrier protein] synthase